MDWHEPIRQNCRKMEILPPKIGQDPKKSEKYAQSTPFTDRSLIRKNKEKVARNGFRIN
jgi:hypothetical protein